MTDGNSRYDAHSQRSAGIEDSAPGEAAIGGERDPLPGPAPGVDLKEFVSARCGARGISTGTATFQPGAALPWHTHPFSEALTVLSGEASCSVEGRAYRLRRFDCIHVPAGTAHQTRNASSGPLIAQWAFAAAAPARDLVEPVATIQNREFRNPARGDPEYIVRFNEAPKGEVAPGIRVFESFAPRFGAVGFGGGHVQFDSGSSIADRVHDQDESVTIVTGEAICEVAGERRHLSGYDTLFVPSGRRHRFSNETGALMAMIWVRAVGTP